VPILFSRTAVKDADGAITDIICIAKDMSGYVRIDDAAGYQLSDQPDQHEQASQAVFPDEVGGLIMNDRLPLTDLSGRRSPSPPMSGPHEEEDTALTAMALKAMAHPLRWKILCSLRRA
jgi:hypothetical protein